MSHKKKTVDITIGGEMLEINRAVDVPRARRTRKIPIEFVPEEDEVELWEEYVKPKPRVFLGCKGKMTAGGLCYNAPINSDYCYLHQIGKLVKEQGQREVIQ